MSQGLSSTLDPRGLRILKRKLKSGEISPQVFKEVLKRQMVKQALKTPARSESTPWGLTWFFRLGQKEQPEVALETYKRCIARFSELAATRPKEPGIKGELEGPWAPGGVDLLPLDRATLLLKQAGRYAELVQIVDAVFSEFPNANRGGGVDDAIIRRRNAAIKKCSITAPPLG